MYYYFFFFNDTATTEIYTLSLHDALPIFDQITCSGANCLISQYSVNKINQDLDLVKQFAWVKSFHESEVLENLHKANRLIDQKDLVDSLLGCKAIMSHRFLKLNTKQMHR